MTRPQTEWQADGTIGNDSITFSYHRASGRFRIAPAHTDLPAITARARVRHRAEGLPREESSENGFELERVTDVEDAQGQAKQHRFVLASSGLSTWLLVNTYASRPFLLMRLVVRNDGSAPIRLDDLGLFEAEGPHGEVRFGDSRQPLAFLKVGWHDWAYTGVRRGREREISTRLGRLIREQLFNPAHPAVHGPGEFWGDGWGILADEKNAVVAGLVSTADQFGVLHARTAGRDGGLALIAQADGIQLDPGETFESEWGYIQFVPLPALDPAGEYVEAVAREMHPRVPVEAPPAKWTHWYHHFQNITEELFLANLAAIDNLRESYPIETVQLDDGYQEAWGDWEACNDKFPHGLHWLAQEIKARGYAPGLWLAPFALDPKSKTAQKHSDWLVHDEKGKPIRAGYLWTFFAQALDTTHPEALQHVEELGRMIGKEWGFDFVKADWCYAAGLPGVRHDKKATRAQAVRRGIEALRRGLGEEVFLLGCGTPFGPAIGLVDAMRIGPDTAPSWKPEIWNMKWVGPIIAEERGMASLRNNIRHTLDLSTLHRRWWWNDPDVVMARKYETKLTKPEIESMLTIVGLSGGLVVNSDDLTRMHPESLTLISLLTPILSPGGRTPDLLEHEMPELYELPVQKEWGSYRLLAVFNWKNHAASHTLDLARLGLAGDKPIHVFDFWTRNYWRQTSRQILLHGIPAHGCRLLRLCEHDQAPRLVGDTLHITQGLELERFELGASEVNIRSVNLGRQLDGELWLWLPQAPLAAECGEHKLIVKRIVPNVYSFKLACEREAEVCIRWE